MDWRHHSRSESDLKFFENSLGFKIQILRPCGSHNPIYLSVIIHTIYITIRSSYIWFRRQSSAPLQYEVKCTEGLESVRNSIQCYMWPSYWINFFGTLRNDHDGWRLTDMYTRRSVASSRKQTEITSKQPVDRYARRKECLDARSDFQIFTVTKRWVFFTKKNWKIEK